MAKKVLVTGISGFVGQHCAVELLKRGYIVRGSLRSLSKAEKVRKGLEKVAPINNNLEFCQLNLLDDKGWEEAMQGIDYVLHIASPFFMTEPKDENKMIRPAVDGALRAMKFAKKAGVKKVVLTSSTVSMAGDKKQNHLTQKSWTNPQKDKVTVYIKSKTMAERAAWDFYTNQDATSKMELTVINPGPIFGPTITGHVGASLEIVQNMIAGKMPQQPNSNYVMSDVRDIARIHVDAMENDASNGQRFIVTSKQTYAFKDIAQILKDNGYDKATPKTAPSFLLKILSLFNRDVKAMMPFLDANVSADIKPTEEIFNWEPIPFKKTVLDTAASLQS